MLSNVILVAEDNPDDALIFKMMFKRATLPHSLYMVQDGQQVIDWLSGSNGYSDRTKFPLPDRVILDLKMPILFRFNVLDWLHELREFKNLPVVILTGSMVEKVRESATKLDVSEFHSKPLECNDLILILKALNTRWLRA